MMQSFAGAPAFNAQPQRDPYGFMLLMFHGYVWPQCLERIITV